MSNFIIRVLKLNKKIQEDDVFPWASMLTFYLLLSLFPLIILITDILTKTSLSDPTVTSYLIELFPPAVFEVIKAIADDIKLSQSSPAIIPISLLLALWSASRGILAIIKALNKAYHIRETRNYFHLRFLALLYTIGYLILIILALLLVVFGNNIYDFVSLRINIPIFVSHLFSVFRFALPIAFSFFFFIFLYNLSPNVKIGIKNVYPGAVIATLGMLISSSGFSIYIRYSKGLSYLYGSLTGFMILIIWLFLISLIIMIGGEVNALFSKHFE